MRVLLGQQQVGRCFDRVVWSQHRQIVLTNVDLPLAPTPYRNGSMCSRVEPVRAVADQSLYVVDELRVAAQYVVQELAPYRKLGVGIIGDRT